MMALVRQAACTIVWLALAADVAAQESPPTARATRIATLGTEDVRGMGEESPNGRFILYHLNAPPEGEPGSLRVLHTRTGETHSLGVDGIEGRWSPDGARIAFTSTPPDATALHVWTLPVDPSSAEPMGPARRAALRMGRGASWSPDGRTLAFTALPSTDTVAPRVVLVPARGGRERVLVSATGWAHAIHWAPDGRSIYYRYVHRESIPPRLLTRASLDGGAPSHLTPFGDLIGFSSDGSFMAYYPLPDPSGGSGPQIQIAASDGRDLTRVRLPFPLLSMRWRSDGHRLFGATRSIGFAVHTLDIRTGAQSVLSDSLGGWAANWEPGGDRIAWISEDDRRILVARADGGDRQTIISEDGPISRIRWSPDATRIAYLADGRRRFGVVSISGGSPTMVSPDRPVWWFRWADDSRSILYVAEGEDSAPEDVRRLGFTGSEEILARLPPEIGPRSAIRIVGDSSLIARDGARVFEVSLHDSSTNLIYTAPTGQLLNDWLAVSHDRQWIAISTFAEEPGVWKPEIVLLPRSGGAARRLPLSGLADVSGIRWHPDGGHLVIAGRPDGEADKLAFFLVPLGGGSPRRLSRDDAPSSNGSGHEVSPHGGQIAFTVTSPEEVTLWEVDLGPTLARFVSEAAIDPRDPPGNGFSNRSDRSPRPEHGR